MYQIGFIRKMTFIFFVSVYYLCIPDASMFSLFAFFFPFRFCFNWHRTIPRICFNLCHFSSSVFVCVFFFTFLYFISPTSSIILSSRHSFIYQPPSDSTNTFNLFINLFIFSVCLFPCLTEKYCKSNENGTVLLNHRILNIS